MTENRKVPAYSSMEAVNALNKVKGFDPTKLIHKDKSGSPVLDLKYKKLWFRLACPNGAIKMVVLKITEQMAIIESRVYKDKGDEVPLSSYISTKYASGKEGKLYIDAAQYESADQALAEAGFGIQFCDVMKGTMMDRLVEGNVISFPAPQPASVQPPATIPPVAAQMAGKPPVATPPSVQDQRPDAEQTPAATSAISVETPAQEPPPLVDLPPVEKDSPEDEQVPVEEHAPAETQIATDETVSVVEQPSEAEPSIVPEPPVVEESAVADAAPTPETAPAKPAPAIALADDSPVEQEDTTVPAYSPDMDVDAICASMTREEAMDIVVDTGTCAGWTLAEVLEKRRASLRWYVNGYTGSNNLLRAGAKIILGEESDAA